jgi:hypothetical protein
MLSSAKVSMNQAITVAEEQGHGQAIDAEYIAKSGGRAVELAGLLMGYLSLVGRKLPYRVRSYSRKRFSAR